MSKVGNLFSIVRAYGLRGLLIPQRLYEDLIASKSLDEFAEKLGPTLYGRCLKELQRPIRLEAVEKAFKTCAVEDEYRLLREVPKPGALEAYFTRHLYRNLKTILKRRAQGEESIPAALCLRAEELLHIRDIVVKAMAEKTLREAAEALKHTPLSPEVLHAVELYEREGDLLVFDVVLDGAFYRRLLRSFKKTPRGERQSLKRAMAPEIDGYLVLAILRSMAWGLTSAETRKFLIEEGVEIGRKTLQQMLKAEKPAEALKPLISTTYWKKLEKVSAESFLELAINVERIFKEIELERVRQAFLRDIFKLSVVYSIIRLRDEEVRNLSAIAFGIAHKVKPQEISQSLSKISLA